MLGKGDSIFLRGGAFTHQFLFELLEEPILIAAMGNFEELPVKLRQLTRPKIASFQERVAFQEVSAMRDRTAGANSGSDVSESRRCLTSQACARSARCIF